jgi:two-component system, response regulator RegA
MEGASKDGQPNVLVVDDDRALCEALARGLASRGNEVRTALTFADAARMIEAEPPDCAVVDLKLADGGGLKLVAALKARNPQARIVVLTGYASIPTAVEAIKLGASYYLAKPANLDEIIAALLRDVGDDAVPVGDKPMSLARLEWEHIQRVLHEHNGNVSSAARALSMHRRTLQRKIGKRPVRT